MTPRPWTTGELKVLRLFASLGSSNVATILERSPSSVEAKAKELKISLLVSEEDFVLTKETKTILERVKNSPTLQICPVCGLRLAIMKSSGICRVCHLDALITLRETQLVEQGRERKLTKLRQDKRRQRICVYCGDAFFPRASATVEFCPKCEGYE
jgi:NADH pyrophosphatase NudC (nudix superfamily)